MEILVRLAAGVKSNSHRTHAALDRGATSSKERFEPEARVKARDVQREPAKRATDTEQFKVASGSYVHRARPIADH